MGQVQSLYCRYCMAVYMTAVGSEVFLAKYPITRLMNTVHIATTTAASAWFSTPGADSFHPPVSISNSYANDQSLYTSMYCHQRVMHGPKAQR